MDPSSESSDTESSVSGLREDDGWEDAEADEEEIQVKSLFDDTTFPKISGMIEYDKDKHDFDLVATARNFNLDFLGVIRLINYVRSEVKAGNQKPDLSSPECFANDKHMQPVLEDDALLFSIDEITSTDPKCSNEGPAGAMATDNEAGASRVTELERELQRLQVEFASYRQAVEETLDKRWNEAEPAGGSASSAPSTDVFNAQSKKADEDAGYFTSYSYNEIHELMLKDTIRTDAYRDFIYDNKQLFKGKTVLDVGCGTGILSMFCAKAGAAKVIAVDNSDIIDRARVNIHKNGLDDVITCVRGKIEEVTLPVKHVDIIVSEWMGYCLLFEAMLDSVLWARDRYLAPNGLMVPSHTVLHIAPVADPEFISDSFEFWYDVYGFDMTAMMESIYDDVLVRQLSPKTIAASSSAFYPIPLHTVKTEDLSFSKEFSIRLTQDIENLDGWVIWFDTFFLTSPNEPLPANARAEDWNAFKDKGVAFTTGPHGKETHWRSGVMAIDRKRYLPKKLASGTDIAGSVVFRKAQTSSRGLEIELNWRPDTSDKDNSQLWFLH